MIDPTPLRIFEIDYRAAIALEPGDPNPATRHGFDGERHIVSEKRLDLHREREAWLTVKCSCGMTCTGAILP